MTPTKIALLAWDGRITATIGSALPDELAEILGLARRRTALGQTLRAGGMRPIYIAHGDSELLMDRFEVSAADIEHLARMVREADRRAHQAGEVS